MGIEYFKQGDLKGALDYFGKATERNSRFSKAWIYKGLICYNLAKYDDSILCYDKAIEINPRNSWAWTNKGQSLIKLNRFEDALESVNTAIEKASRNADAWGIKGDCLYKLEKYEDAIECYERAIEINPRNIWNWIGNGEALISLGNSKDAIDCFDKAIEFDPKIPEAWFNKAKALYQQGELEKSLGCINRAIEYNSQDGAAWYLKCSILTSDGKNDEAKICHKKSIELGFQPSDSTKSKIDILQKTDHPRATSKIIRIAIGEREYQTDISENTMHEGVQYLLLKLGSEMGLDVWVARNDKGKEVNGCRFIDIPRFMNELPRQFDESTNKTVELIDVLWLKDKAIMAAFEIECTTSIYSGLLRMSDLISMQPNLNIPLYIVAPDERRRKVISEINRPTFSKLTPPLNKICRYIPISKLREKVLEQLGLVRYLKPEYLNEISESC